MNDLNSVLMGAVAMSSLVATIFFARFWKQTRDPLFIYFSVAFALDAVTRFALGLTEVSEETQPFFYLARLVTFGIIIFAIINKNTRKG